MKKRVLIFVHTEYHLIHAINQIYVLYNNEDYENYIVFRNDSKSRLDGNINAEGLPCNVMHFEGDLTFDSSITPKLKSEIDKLMEIKPDIFVFFQEQSLLMIVLSQLFKDKGSEIHLYQDGQKPYVHLKYVSLGMISFAWKTNVWLKKNGYKQLGISYLLNSKEYGHLQTTDKLFLTFEKEYLNWNSKITQQIIYYSLPLLKGILEKVFYWDDKFLPEKEGIIFFLNQQTRDDGLAELELLENISKIYSDKKIYVKLHPHTPEEIINERYKKIANVKAFKSKIPAELFILQLKNSIILSISSTSMFLNNPECKYYYVRKLLVGKIPRLKRYKQIGEPAKHINYVKSVDEISF